MNTNHDEESYVLNEQLGALETQEDEFAQMSKQYESELEDFCEQFARLSAQKQALLTRRAHMRECARATSA
jgi:hypothetical protein